MGAPLRRGARALAFVAALAAISVLGRVAGRWAVERRIGHATGLAVSLAGLGVTWSPLGVELRGLALRVRPGATALVEVERLRWPLAGGSKVARGVRLRLSSPRELRDAALVGAPDERDRAGLRVGEVGLEDVRLELPPEPSDGRGLRSVRLPALRVRRFEAALRGFALLARGRLETAGGSMRGRLRWDARRRDLLASLRFDGVDLASLPRSLLGGAVASGRAAGRLRYERSWSAQRPRERLAGRLRVAALRSGTGAAAGPISVSGVDVGARGLSLDLRARRAVVRGLRLRGGIVRLRAPARPVREAPLATVLGGWQLRVGRLDARAIVLASAAVPELPALRIGRLAARGIGTEGTFELDASPSSGGAIRANGGFGGAQGDLSAEIELAGLELGPWLDPLARPLGVRGGRVDAQLELRGPPGLRGRGTVDLRDLEVVGADGGAESELGHLGRLALRLRGFTALPPRLWLGSADMEDAFLALRLGPDGLEPFASLVAGDATSSRARAAVAWLGRVLGEAPPFELDAVDVTAGLRRGGLRFVDQSGPEPVAVDVDDLRIEVEGEGGPPWHGVHARLSGRLDGAVPLEARGAIEDDRLRIAGAVGAVPLDRWDAYLAAALGVVARRGAARGSFELVWDQGVHASSRIEIEGLTLRRRGADRFGPLLGIPLDRALELAMQPKGRVALALRLEGDAERPALGLPAALREAFADAVADAASAPLFAGAEDVGRPRGEAVRLAPLAFVAGDVQPAPGDEGTIERLGLLLRREPALAVTIEGRVGEADAELLRSDDALHALARARAAAVRAGLLDAFGIEPSRVSLADPGVGDSDVRIVLHALPAAALERSSVGARAGGR